HENVRLDGRSYAQPPSPVFGPARGKVAVVGAGCAGLGAASDLAKLGFGGTVLDALDQAGGTALAGVPPFRLPREVIDRDINGIVNDNVELRLSTPPVSWAGSSSSSARTAVARSRWGSASSSSAVVI